MKICMSGTGYVGLVTGTCLAEMGNDVIGVDIDEEKVKMLREGRSPIYEPGLEEMIRRNLAEGRLAFTSSLADAVRRSELIFIAVGTPESDDGSADLSNVFQVVREVARHMDGYRIIVNKSTVPVGTADKVRELLSAGTRHEFDVVSNPEFLKEGAALEDFMRPDRVVIGVSSQRPVEIMREIYAPFTRTGAPILVMDNRSAEMTKYVANALLASRISFMNEMANLCEHLGVDIHWVRQGVGFDRRIGPSFLFPGVGYGGSCFPKDISSLIKTGQDHSFPLRVVSAVQEVNEIQKRVIVEKMVKFYASETARRLEDAGASPDPGKLSLAVLPGASQTAQSSNRPFAEKTFAVWGLAFKPQTDDMREAPSLVIIDLLLELGARIRAYDPQAMREARRAFGDRIEYCPNNYEALRDADALVLVTEWNAFRRPDFHQMKKLLKHPVVFDGRNQYDPDEMRELGFYYFGIGRP